MNLSKVATGIQYGDASNIAVRNILTMVSIYTYGKFTEQDMTDTLDFFDWKCPYTGRALRGDIKNGNRNCVADHIVPQNKESCGLNVKGNLVMVDAKANSAKGNKTVKDFLLYDQTVLNGVSQQEREERLDKIKDFQRKYNYDPDKIVASVQPILKAYYDDLRKIQETMVKYVIAASGLTKLTPIAPTKTPQGRASSTQLVLVPGDEQKFHALLIQKQKALITLTYDTGAVRTMVWQANNINTTSNIRANIQSRPFWRRRKTEGLVKVEVSLQ